ncbi:MAG: SGNH/GDSL hydrolase family protein [Microgenomates group bacterium]
MCIFFLVRYIIIKQKGLFQIHPLASFAPTSKSSTPLQYYYELTPNTQAYDHASWLTQDVVYHYNADGLHERFDYPVQKDAHVYRIITLGDSFTFGMWVNTEANFSELLEDALNTTASCPGIDRFEVINLGVPGYDLHYAFQRFEDKGSKYAPDAVIWFLRGENFILHTELYRDLEETYKKTLKEKTVETSDQSDMYAASTLAYQAYMDAYATYSAEKQEQIKQEELKNITALSKRYSIPIVLVTLEEESEENKKSMQQLALRGKNIWYDAVVGADTFHPNDYHLNAPGHTRIAQTVFTFLLSHFLQSCRMQ